MGTSKGRRPDPVQFFASVIFTGDDPPAAVLSELGGLLGPEQERTASIPFTQTDYYAKEMGQGLSRVFILFETLRERDELPEAKISTNNMEAGVAVCGKRRVNIDPGYLALEQVVLATTKGYAHRIYLGRGIFADLTLVFRNGTYRPLEWTYPDYGGNECITLFNKWRDACKKRLREKKVG